MRLVHRFSRGVPRIINTICERSLLAVFSRGQNRVGAKLVWQASKEVKGARRTRRLWPWFAIGLVAFIALIYFSLSSLFMAEKVSVEIVSTLEERDETEKITEPVAIQPVVAEPKTMAESPIEIISEPEPEPEPEASVEKVAPESEVEQTPVTPVVTSPEIEPAETADNIEVEMGSEEPPAEDYSLPELFEQNQNRRLVYQRLFSLWQQAVNLNSLMTPCMQAPQKGLRCLRDILDWDQLYSLNRPFIFRLRRDKQTRMLLLKRLDGDRLLVDDGVEEAFLKLDDIQPYWSGEFVMLWRPHGGVALIGDGSAGDAVTWLRNRLQLVDGEPVVSKPGLDQFDEALKARLLSFQQSNGLMADGMAGQQTLVYLNNLSLPQETPTLYTLEERGDG
jgi:general secretion pathway protein A